MVIKIGRKAGSSLCVKFAHLWDLQVCNSYHILFVTVIASLFFCVYLDILHFTPSGGLLLNLSAISSFSHSTALTGAKLRPSPIVSPRPSPLHQGPSTGYHIHKPREKASKQSTTPSGPDASGDNDASSIRDSNTSPTVKSSQSATPVVDTPESTSSPSDESAQSNTKQAQNSPVSTNSTENATSPSVNPSAEAPESRNATIEAEDLEEEEIYERPKRKEGECNLYAGKWVRDEANYPLYRSMDCPFVDDGFRCQENGRPDEAYLKWRWQPSACNLPRFESENMLNMLRGRRLVFVGDSIGRNQWESLLCMLATQAANKTRIYEVNGEPITKHKGFLIFKFEAYNNTIEYYRSPFLVPQGRPPRNAPKEVRTTLRVDTMDWTSKRWRGADIIVFNTGHWWSYEKTIRGGCFFQVGDKVDTSMSVRDGFEKAMQTWRRWVASNIDPSKTRIFFRTYAPVHFSGGTWKTGGRCDEEREPHGQGSKFGGEPWTNGVVVEQVAREGHTQLLDITHLSLFRKDAHSSIYTVGPHQPRPFNRQDCSHWCLPGLPDTWNELMYASLLQSRAAT